MRIPQGFAHDPHKGCLIQTIPNTKTNSAASSSNTPPLWLQASSAKLVSLLFTRSSRERFHTWQNRPMMTSSLVNLMNLFSKDKSGISNFSRICINDVQNEHSFLHPCKGLQATVLVLNATDPTHPSDTMPRLQTLMSAASIARTTKHSQPQARLALKQTTAPQVTSWGFITSDSCEPNTAIKIHLHLASSKTFLNEPLGISGPFAKHKKHDMPTKKGLQNPIPMANHRVFTQVPSFNHWKTEFPCSKHTP